jgi:hypothetical protein
MESPLLGYDGSINTIPESTRKPFKLWQKILLFSLATLIIFLSTRVDMSPVSHSKCFNDEVFNLTSPLNSYFADHPSIRDLFEILSSFFLDVNLLSFLGYYVLWGDSWRPILFGSGFYAIRGSLQALTVLGFPEGFIWTFPGIYSFAITYVRSSDFFYSGHVGVMLFLAIYFRTKGFRKMMYYSIFCSVFEGIVMVIVRCHYGIDVVGGALFCHYLWIMSEYPARYVDSFSFPKQNKG